MKIHFRSNPRWPTVGQRVTSVFDSQLTLPQLLLRNGAGYIHAKSKTLVLVVDKCPMFEVAAISYCFTHSTSNTGRPCTISRGRGTVCHVPVRSALSPTTRGYHLPSRAETPLYRSNTPDQCIVTKVTLLRFCEVLLAGE